MKCPSVKKECSPSAKDCGHTNCHLGTNLCCECEDKLPLHRRYGRYVDGKWMVSVPNTRWGYCSGCKPPPTLPGKKRCFCGVTGCELTSSDWCCACLDARPTGNCFVPYKRYKRGQRGVLCRGVHYCSNCVKLENVVKEPMNAVKNERTEHVRALESPATPVVVPAPAKADSLTTAFAGSSGPATQTSLTTSFGLSQRPSDKQGHGYHMFTPAPEENTDVNVGPPVDRWSANATMSPPEVTDDECLFLFPEKPAAIEMPVDFELVEHAEVAEMGWKTTRTKWSWLF